MEGFIGEIKLFGGNFAPRSWALCDGQLLAISSNSALFSILGTTYGGDGRTTFALPDLRSRVAIHPGTGPGLSTYRLGQRGGTENTTLNVTNLPSHNHIATHDLKGTVRVNEEDAESEDPKAKSFGNFGTNAYNNNPPDTEMKANNVSVQGNITVGNTGSNIPFNNVQPFTVCNYIICLQGIFPSRN